MKLGLIGQQLSHSFSKQYFEEKFMTLHLNDPTYDLIEVDSINLLPDIICRLHLDGFNVTIPYKRAILPFLNNLDPAAAEIGAVNTVKVHWFDDKHFALSGYNTDAPAFLQTLRPLLQPWHRNALILGTGGAARAVAWALTQLCIDYHFVSRNPAECDFPSSRVINYANPQCIDPRYTLFINATPVGMHPAAAASPWPYPQHFNPRHLCYDLIYNPSPTLLMKEAAAMGATVKDGLEMLHLQANLAWQIWKQ